MEPSVLNVLYDGIPAENSARKLIVDVFFEHGTAQWSGSTDCLLLLHHEFLFEVTVRLLTDRPFEESSKNLSHESWNYHEHLGPKPQVSGTPQIKYSFVFRPSEGSQVATQTTRKPEARVYLPKKVQETYKTWYGTARRFLFLFGTHSSQINLFAGVQSSPAES